MPTEKEIIDQLRRGKVSLPPLSFSVLELPKQEGGKRSFDALVAASWCGKKVIFAMECKSLSTPKVFQEGLNQLKSWTLPKGYRPLLCLPFLSEQQLQKLEHEGISGIDLCGNGVVTAPGKFSIFRSGGKNRFSSSAPIKNIYRKNSSMVCRMFLTRPSYDSVQEIHTEINKRNMLVNRWGKKPMSLSTVSKSLKTLEEDLVVGRKEVIRLLQPEKLLEKLTEYYNSPKITDKVRFKVKGDAETIRTLLLKKSQELDIPLVTSGISSVTRFAVMQRADVLSIYCPFTERLINQLPGSRSDRFPNLEIIETEDETVYFGAWQEDGFWWASPVQVYLELMAGDKRDQETAEQAKSYILKNLKVAE